jgi:predicted nucleic-acid-binding Zn-ribbon protein
MNGQTEHENQCPKCGSENIEYGSIEPAEGAIYYPATCADCLDTFKEWYNLEFTESVSDDYKD